MVGHRLRSLVVVFLNEICSNQEWYTINIFLISPEKNIIILWVLIRSASSNEYPQLVFV